MIEIFNQHKYKIAILAAIFMALVGVSYTYYTYQPLPSSMKIQPSNEKNTNEKELPPQKLPQIEFTNFLQQFFKHLQSSTKSLIKLNKDTIKQQTSIDTYKNLFQKDIEKIKILVDSKNITHDDSHSTSNYTIFFSGDSTNNKTGGFGVFKNVIGFRLLKAFIPNSSHHVTDNNRSIRVTVGATTKTLTLTNGSYSIFTLGEHLKSILAAGFASGTWNVVYSNVSQKYTISHNTTSFTINWENSSSYRLFGFRKSTVSIGTSVTSDHAIDLSSHFIDVVIPQIPYIACKYNGRGDSIVERIPLNNISGSLVTHYPNSDEGHTQNFFYPISLDKINIQLYEDTDGNFYDAQNADNAFEFELTILKNISLLN